VVNPSPAGLRRRPFKDLGVLTPSQQTNQILQLMRQLQGSDSENDWSELGELVRKRLQGQRSNREEFEAKAQARGEAFVEQARGRIVEVQVSFDRYASCLEEIELLAQARSLTKLGPLLEQLTQVTQGLFEALDAYAAFYFAWGENQSPLVTMIRHAVESYSKSALQSAQAQRILKDMQEHLANSETDKPEKAGEA